MLCQELDYAGGYEIMDPTPTLPLKIFDAAPPKSAIVVLCLEVLSDTSVSLVVSGGTWAYKGAFTAAGIGGGYAETTGTADKGPYART